jgi:hydroxyethylthiazole kinase-like uncharacterized protein yjeF
MDMPEPAPQLLQRLFTRPAASHKYDFGHVLIIGGAPGMVGAPYLSARAALRCGAGLVTIASTAEVIDKLERDVEEVMTLRLPTGNSAAADTLRAFIGERQVKVIAIGPGLASSRASMVRQLLQTAQPALVLDAGGLGAYNNDLPGLYKLSQLNNGMILSPHTGEFRRLIGKALPVSSLAIKKLVVETARATGATIILKGDHSLIAAANGHTYINSTGNPGLATAGTGDVLTGLVASLLAQDFSAFEAAVGAVYLHGLAGDLAAAAKTQPGLIASDIIDYLPAALKQADTSRRHG